MTTLSCDSLPDSEHLLLGAFSDSLGRGAKSTVSIEAAACMAEMKIVDARWALVSLEELGAISLTEGEITVENICKHGLFLLLLRRHDAGVYDTRGAGIRSDLASGASRERSDPAFDSDFDFRVRGSGGKGAPAPAGTGGSRLDGTPKRVRRLTTGYLARFYFPQACGRAGMKETGATNYGALIRNFKSWDCELDLIRLMIDVFGMHPEWSRGKIPWRVFLARRAQLAEMARRQLSDQRMEQRRDDPGSIWIPHQARKLRSS